MIRRVGPARRSSSDTFSILARVHSRASPKSQGIRRLGPRTSTLLQPACSLLDPRPPFRLHAATQLSSPVRALASGSWAGRGGASTPSERMTFVDPPSALASWMYPCPLPAGNVQFCTVAAAMSSSMDAAAPCTFLSLLLRYFYLVVPRTFDLRLRVFPYSYPKTPLSPRKALEKHMIIFTYSTVACCASWDSPRLSRA